VVEGSVSTGLEATLDVRRSDSFRLDMGISVAPGRTAALLGPNGAGKSTVVAALAGILPLDAGRIELGDAVLDDPAGGVFVAAEDRSVGVVFQDYLLFPHLSVLENIAFGPRSRGLARSRARDRATEWIERLELGGLQERRPRDLSGGQAQRVALARTLATEPDLLLLDEPLAALDVTTRSEVRWVLAEHLQAFDGPRLLITHDPQEAFLLADEIHVLEDGRVTQAGTADDIRLRPRTRYAADRSGGHGRHGRTPAAHRRPRDRGARARQPPAGGRLRPPHASGGQLPKQLAYDNREGGGARASRPPPHGSAAAGRC
jgi:molybdate transport system ATP-binding protein